MFESKCTRIILPMKLIEILKTNSCIEQSHLAPIELKITLDNIINAVYNVTGINGLLLPMRTRKREIADARHLFFYFARRKTVKSLQQIGDEVCRDHASVLHGAKKIDDLRKTNLEIKNFVKEIESML